jgi:hypothetical protein
MTLMLDFRYQVAAETNAIARATYEDHDGNRTVKEVAIYT